MSAHGKMLELVSEQKIKVLEDVIEHAQRLILMEQGYIQRIAGPFWACLKPMGVCGKVSRGKDVGRCPKCGGGVRLISREEYVEAKR